MKTVSSRYAAHQGREDGYNRITVEADVQTWAQMAPTCSEICILAVVPHCLPERQVRSKGYSQQGEPSLVRKLHFGGAVNSMTALHPIAEAPDLDTTFQEATQVNTQEALWMPVGDGICMRY